MYNTWQEYKEYREATDTSWMDQPSAGQLATGQKMEKNQLIKVISAYFGNRASTIMLGQMHAELSDFVNRVGVDRFKRMQSCGLVTVQGNRVHFNITG